MNHINGTLNSEKSSPDATEKDPQLSGLRLFATGVAVTAAVAAMYTTAAPLVNPAFGRIRVPFMRSANRQTKNVFKLLEGRNGTLVDLGSGDGSVVIEAAKRGFQSTGYEQNPWLVYYSRLKARQLGLHRMAAFHRKNFIKADVTKYDNIVLFGKESKMMVPLQSKLADELRIEGHVVVSQTPLPDWMPLDSVEENLDSAWLYDRTSINSAGFRVPVF